MKVLFISKIPPWSSLSGGLENHILNLSVHLSKLGCSIAHACWDRSTREVDYHDMKWHTIRLPLGIDSSIGFAMRRMFLLRFVNHVHRILRERSFDVIHCQGIGGVVGAIARILTAEDAPMVFTLHGIWHRHFVGGATVPVRLIAYCEELLTVKSAERVISVSRADVRAASKIYRIPLSKIEYIPNGVDASVYRPQRATREGGCVNLLYVARLVRQKGPGYLIRAFQKVIKRCPHVRLHIVGGGPLYPSLLRAVKSGRMEGNVVMHGRVSDREKIRLYQMSDIFVMTSLYEGFSMTCAEAAACGLPIVAFNVGGVGEAVIHGRNGLLVPINVDALAEAIVTLVEDEGLRRRMGAEGRSYVRKNLDWGMIARKTLRLYRDIKRSKRP